MKTYWVWSLIPITKRKTNDNKFIFSADSSGVKNQVRYLSEEFELFDEETNWYSEVHKFRTYEWKDGALYPPFKRENNYEEEVQSEE